MSSPQKKPVSRLFRLLKRSAFQYINRTLKHYYKFNPTSTKATTPICNVHCLCNEGLSVWRQMRWGGYDTGTVSRVSGKAMNRFQCTWIAMIGEIYRLIVKYLGK